MMMSVYLLVLAASCLLLAWSIDGDRNSRESREIWEANIAYRRRPNDLMRSLRSDGSPSGTHAR